MDRDRPAQTGSLDAASSRWNCSIAGLAASSLDLLILRLADPATVETAPT